MSTRNSKNVLDSFESYENLPRIKNVPSRELRSLQHPARRRAQSHKKPRPAQDSLFEELAKQEEEFHFTYHASRHEREWIVNSIGRFYEEKWIDDVLQLIKGGKEASVYLCEANPSVTRDLIAAKVYRPRRFRNLRKDFVYQEGRHRLDGDGRTVTDDGMNHAMDKRTAYGLELLHASWIAHEFKTMQILHQAGADIPAPLACGHNAVLMEYIGDETMPAPPLSSVNLDPGEAQPLFERVVWNIDRMLANKRIHADLSAYNILYWDSKMALIDFPQAIEPESNPNAYRIFQRDVRRICDYFSAQGLSTDAQGLAQELWTSYGYPLKIDIHPKYLEE